MIYNKIKADLLETVRNGIKIGMKNSSMTIAYSTALEKNINAVNRKFPGRDKNKTRLNINENIYGRIEEAVDVELKDEAVDKEEEY